MTLDSKTRQQFINATQRLAMDFESPATPWLCEIDVFDPKPTDEIWTTWGLRSEEDIRAANVIIRQWQQSFRKWVKANIK